MKRLPVSIADFEGLRQTRQGHPGFVYVDKTQLVHRLVSESKYVFLSRPRRFGKSLLVSTLDCLFQGKRSLFEGLWIADQWDWATTHPVIKVDFNSVTDIKAGFASALEAYIDLQAQLLGLSLQRKGANAKLQELIILLYQQTGQKVVVLIDEYDKPITELLQHVPMAEANRDLLKDFYTILKGSEQFLHFVLLTGVSKIGKLSVFSGLNNLKDITLNPKYTTLLGYTDVEVDHYFGEHLQAWAAAQGNPYDALRTSFRNWYNGYSWGGLEKLYNPWSVLNALDDFILSDYWYATGTPKFLIDGMKQSKTHLPNLEGFWTTRSLHDSASLENLDVLSLLWQTGYLSIKASRSSDTGEPDYLLGIPNYEVRKALLVSYLADGWPHPHFQPRLLAGRISRALANYDLADFFEVINLLLAGIPYHQYQGQNEAFFHAVVHVAVALSGHRVASEVAMATGRIDAVVEAPRYVYVFEFKLTTPEDALAQIKANNYATPYLNRGKTVIATAAAFDAHQRTLKGWLSEVL